MKINKWTFLCSVTRKWAELLVSVFGIWHLVSNTSIGIDTSTGISISIDIRSTQTQRQSRVNILFWTKSTLTCKTIPYLDIPFLKFLIPIVVVIVVFPLIFFMLLIIVAVCPNFSIHTRPTWHMDLLWLDKICLNGVIDWVGRWMVVGQPLNVTLLRP